MRAFGEFKTWLRRRPVLYRVARVAASVLRLVLATPGSLRYALVCWRTRRRGARPPAAPTGGASREVAMLVISEVHYDPRAERSARTLARAGYRVKVLHPNLSGLPGGAPAPEWGEGVSFRTLPASAGDFIFRYPYVLGSRFLEAALEERPFAFHCHDLSTSVIGLEAARAAGARCVCDFREWYAENVSWDAVRERYRAHPWYTRSAYRWAERRVLREADAVLTVCDSIAAGLRRACPGGVPVHVVRNLPLSPPGPVEPGEDLRTRIGVGAGTFVLLYQGGVGPSRHLEPVIQALARVPDTALVIRGPGIERFEAHYASAARGAGVAGRVFCLPPVPGGRVIPEAASADAGIWTLADLCLNFRFSLPNKLFEYLAAGLPVLAADYPEVRLIVEGYEVGACFDSDSPPSIAAALERMRSDAGWRARCRANIPGCLARHDGDAEWAKLVDLYRGLETAIDHS